MQEQQILAEFCESWLSFAAGSLKSRFTAAWTQTSPRLWHPELFWGQFVAALISYYWSVALRKTFPACFVTSGELSIMSYSITFYLAVGLTALSFVLERKEGLMDRCWVAGKSITHVHTHTRALKNYTRAVLYFVSRGSAVINKGRELVRSYLFSNYDSF